MKNDHRHLTTTLWAWNDLLWALLASFMLVTALLITQIQVMRREAKTEDEKAPGNISVYIFWPDGIDLDIDTHLADPAGDHVYFGKLSGRVWNLLRDDLGMLGDNAARNFENAYTRGIPAGDYIINVHAYRGQASMYPVTIEAEVRIAADPGKGKGAQKVVTQKVTLYRTGEEATLVRFAIDANMALVPGSLSHVFKPLIEGR